MNLISQPDNSVVRTALDQIIKAHGLWPVLKALAARSLQKRPLPVRDVSLSNHLRRDIGLQPMPDPDRSPLPHW